MTNVYRLWGGLVVVAAAAGMGLAGCGGSGSPHVASLGSNGSNSNSNGSPTTTLPKGNPTQLLDEWASCMRSNGDPTQTDPTVDANGVIHITFPASAANGSDFGGPGGRNGPCGAYLTAASTALRGGQPLQRPDQAKLEKYSQCMRAHGVPDFPDPSPGGGLSIQVHPGSDLSPNNPTFQNASKLCAKKTGVPGLGGTPPRGAIMATSGNGPSGGPGGNGGSSSKGIASGGGGA
jgi:hypothetical protein